MSNKAKQLTEAAIGELKCQLDAGRSEVLTHFLNCMSKFHRYSWSNIMLIHHQRPNATHIAGFHTWRAMDRWVRKGESGIAILAPMVRSRKSMEHPSLDDLGGEQPRSISGFRVVHVFDVSQTEGKELPALSKPVGDPGASLQHLEQLIQQSGIEIRYETMDAGTMGYSAGGRIGIEQSLSDPERFSTLAHELAHEWLDHKAAPRPLTIKETEAEAVAYVVCRASGLQAPGSSEYIQLYQGNAELLTDSLGRIQQVAARILNGIADVTSLQKAA